MLEIRFLHINYLNFENINENFKNILLIYQFFVLFIGIDI